MRRFTVSLPDDLYTSLRRRGQESAPPATLQQMVRYDIDVSIEDNVLTLKAERKAGDEGEGVNYLVRERPVGSFYRALRLPDTVDTAKVQSYYENGILSIHLPKAEAKKKKQIQIKVGSGAKAIEAAKK